MCFQFEPKSQEPQKRYFSSDKFMEDMNSNSKKLTLGDIKLANLINGSELNFEWPYNESNTYMVMTLTSNNLRRIQREWTVSAEEWIASGKPGRKYEIRVFDSNLYLLDQGNRVLSLEEKQAMNYFNGTLVRFNPGDFWSILEEGNLYTCREWTTEMPIHLSTI